MQTTLTKMPGANFAKKGRKIELRAIASGVNFRIFNRGSRTFSQSVNHRSNVGAAQNGRFRRSMSDSRFSHRVTPYFESLLKYQVPTVSCIETCHFFQRIGFSSQFPPQAGGACSTMLYNVETHYSFSSAYERRAK